ncbi:MAG: hypothetical protein IKZ45_00310, partial [Fibrobacter sp.]|nr:hypothetical protein [Fibrobacter sp.]
MRDFGLRDAVFGRRAVQVCWGCAAGGRMRAFAGSEMRGGGWRGMRGMARRRFTEAAIEAFCLLSISHAAL